jgi:hypothetical protein
MAKDPLHLEPPIKAVIDATNAGNHKAFVDAFTKNGSVNDWGHLHAGRREITAWDQTENTGAKAQVRVTGVSRLGGEVLVLVAVTLNGETSSSTWSFRLAGGKVDSLEIG